MGNILGLSDTLLKWAQALIVLLIFYPVGLLMRKVVFFYFEKWTAKSENKYDDIVVARSRAHVLFWAILMGLYLASRIAPIEGQALAYSHKAIFSLFIISLTFLAANIISDIIKEYSRKASINAPLTSLTDNLIKIVVVTLGGLMLLSHLGISITPLLTALGVGSLAVALALQDTLSNLFSGFYIIANKQIRTGEYIKLDSGQEGYLVDIGWRTTRIRVLANNMIIIPNAKLGSAIVTNFHMPDKEMGLVLQVGVSYSSDLEKVEKVTIEVARETLRGVSGGVESFEPFVRYNSFGDSAIQFSVILRVKEFTDQYLVTHEFIKRLHKRYNLEGIDIPFPQRTVHLINPDKK